MALTGRPALIAAAVFAALAAVASRADADGLLARADRAAYEKVRASRREPAVAAARRVSALAEPTVIYPVVAAVGLLARRDTRWRRASTACLVVAAGAATRRQLSRLIARPRPPAQAWLIAPEGYSLPSKHTTVAVLAAGVSVHTLGVTGAPAQAVRLLTAAAVGTSRVCLGVHWPADVISGWLFAEGWLRLTGWAGSPAPSRVTSAVKGRRAARQRAWICVVAARRRAGQRVLSANAAGTGSVRPGACVGCPHGA